MDDLYPDETIDDVFDPEEDQDFDSEYIKFVADGATTIADAAACLEGLAAWLRRVEKAGFQLSEPVDSGWMHFTHPEGKKLYVEADGKLESTVE